MTVQGRVLWFNRDKGYGFISVCDGQDVFAHHSEFRDCDAVLWRDDLVEFEIIPGDRGPKAIQIRKIQPESLAGNA